MIRTSVSRVQALFSTNNIYNQSSDISNVQLREIMAKMIKINQNQQ